MDFKRQEGESERAYYSRVATELKYGARKGFDLLREYQLGRSSVVNLEKSLVKAFSKGKKSA